MSPLRSRLIAFTKAGAVAFVITAIGQGVWGSLAFLNLRFTPDIPWAAPVMALILLGLMAYLAGHGWPKSTASARRTLVRLNPIPSAIFFQAIVAGVLADVALGGLWLVTSDLVALPRGLAPDTHAYPLLTGLALLVIACLAAPLSEEAAFRGYAQGLLEKSWGSAPAAIIGSSVLFAAVHVTQGLFLPKLGLYFTAGLIFGAIAYLTNSLCASMAVHSLADVMGFLFLWPHDARPHGLISAGGSDPVFWPALIALAIATPLSLAAFARLARLQRANPSGRLANAPRVQSVAAICP